MRILPLAIVLVLLQRAPVAAQRCFRGRPLPTCKAFWLTETGAGYRVNRFYSPYERDHDGLGSIEVGLMRNRGRMALGGTVFLGVGDQITGNTGVLVGLKPRLRRWLSPALSLDGGAGPAIVLYGDSNQGRLALTGHIGITLGDFVGVSTEVLLGPTPGFPKSGPTKAGLYLGGKLGSYPGVISGVAVPALALLFVALHVYSDD